MSECNPNGANQYKPDPRQSLFLKYYFDPKSETFSNCLQSAVKAGFTKEYAENLMHLRPEWLSDAIEKHQDSEMVEQAENNLREFLKMKTDNIGMTKDGGVYNYTDPRLIKIKADITKFTLERIYKGKYSQKIFTENQTDNSEALGVLKDFIEAQRPQVTPTTSVEAENDNPKPNA